ncbi:MAG: class I SAM-dependent methyltransferase [Prevotellaceae bacterium]|jgi:ubiquinone/menaquinone biosynthesis C-methylase UbiE|nr:class I SAM-dependent methyltransferase [Prevotellaceae bacterium]
MELKVRDDLQSEYENDYVEGQTEWRRIGAKGKFSNIITLTQGMTFEKILEVGAGDGSILKLLDIGFASQLFALEISENGISTIKNRNIKNLIEAVKFDGYKIPYPDNFFDLLILSHVLEHVEYPRALLREMKRVSKFQVIEVPREYHHNIDRQINKYLAYGHISVYTPTYLRFLLKSEGFEIIKDKKGFYSNETLRFGKKGYKLLKINIFIIIRNIIYLLLPEWRKDTMVNWYTVLTKK